MVGGLAQAKLFVEFLPGGVEAYCSNKVYYSVNAELELGHEILLFLSELKFFMFLLAVVLGFIAMRFRVHFDPGKKLSGHLLGLIHAVNLYRKSD